MSKSQCSLPNCCANGADCAQPGNVCHNDHQAFAQWLVDNVLADIRDAEFHKQVLLANIYEAEHAAAQCERDVYKLATELIDARHPVNYYARVIHKLASAQSELRAAREILEALG